MPSVAPRPVVSFLVAALFAACATAGPLEDGTAAYQEKDYLKAIQLWRPLAQAGDPAAQYRLGVMYAEGRGVAANDAEAALWFERAAEQGEPMAQYNLGASYAEGTVRCNGIAQWRWSGLRAGDGRCFRRRVRRQPERKRAAGGVEQFPGG